jgi:hypothetical protein
MTTSMMVTGGRPHYLNLFTFPNALLRNKKPHLTLHVKNDKPNQQKAAGIFATKTQQSGNILEVLSS